MAKNGNPTESDAVIDELLNTIEKLQIEIKDKESII
jgi:hypothetical protein